MVGIYLHIPFCKQRCHYCNFHFAISLRYKNEMMAALLSEIRLQEKYLLNEEVATVYFGGGTPSILLVQEIKQLLAQIKNTFSNIPNAEITLEANPDDITEEKLVGWKEAGVNRLSIGVQSFYANDLQWMNRAHTAEEAINQLKLAINYFPNLSIDLIYGTPFLTNERWKQNVETALQLNISHLSCYALTVEPKTPLDKMIRLKKSPEINSDKQAEQFLLLMGWMEKAGYEHYEISNFAKPGMRSRHNGAYWSLATSGKPTNYLGIGPSAHSYNGASRQWNVANNQQYIDAITKREVPFEIETLTLTQQVNEYIMTSLRTIEGINLSILKNYFATDQAAFEKRITKFLENGLVKKEGTAFILTCEGKLLADGIASELFFEEE